MREVIVAIDPIGEGLAHHVMREEVVRCRDCKHWRETPMADGSKGHRRSGVMTFVEPDPDGFCSWGERRKEDGQ